MTEVTKPASVVQKQGCCSARLGFGHVGYLRNMEQIVCYNKVVNLKVYTALKKKKTNPLKKKRADYLVAAAPFQTKLPRILLNSALLMTEDTKLVLKQGRWLT